MKFLPQPNLQKKPEGLFSRPLVHKWSRPRTRLLMFGVGLSLLLCATEIKAAGTLDPSFGTGGKVITGYPSTYANTILLQPDGKIIVVANSFANLGTGVDFAAVRYNSDGTLDVSFNNGGRAIVDIGGLNNYAEKGLLQPDGKIIIIGHIHPPPPSALSDFAMARLNADGTIDTSFGVGGSITLDFALIDLAYDVGLQSNGKIIIMGHNNSDILMARYNANGGLDGSFGLGGKVSTDVGDGTADTATTMVIQPDDKIIMAGTSNASGMGQILLRYDSTGHLDPSFGVGGIAQAPVGGAIADLVLQPDGKIVTGGTNGSGTNNFAVARYLSDGNVDLGFGVGGMNSTDFLKKDDQGFAVAIRSDGKIVVAGQASYGSGFDYPIIFGVALYNSDGSFEASAYTEFVGYKAYGRAVAIQPDGKLVVAGQIQAVSGGLINICMARYTSIFFKSTTFDFDRDGRTDIGVYRPGGGSHWYTIRSSWFYPSPNQVEDVQFGSSGDVIVPGDYNGDGRTDYGIFRPSTGIWYTSLDPAQNYGAFHWGQSGDVPVPGDYDGDGKTDRAIYRPSTETWWVSRSSDGGYIQQVFGTSTDKPVIGDFDGDTKTDFAYVTVEGPSLVWNILQSSNSVTVVQQFGFGTDTPVTADYDGDGKTNIAVFRASTGHWYTSLDPATGYGDVQWGRNGDVPVPGDYDGDGRADVAVYRPSNSNWYIRRSVDLLMDTERWGLSTDLPVPSAFTPQ